jgi:hypothetical protein
MRSDLKKTESKLVFGRVGRKKALEVSGIHLSEIVQFGTGRKIQKIEFLSEFSSGLFAFGQIQVRLKFFLLLLHIVADSTQQLNVGKVHFPFDMLPESVICLRPFNIIMSHIKGSVKLLCKPRNVMRS